jgi:peptide/nickel transport system substrate-binding protein
VFKFIPDSAAEQQAYKTGQVLGIYPQAQLELADLKNLPDTKFDVVSSLSYEALWMNTTKEPVNSKAVRQALAYATDREAAVQTLFGPVQPDIKPIQSFATPANKQWYSDPFKKYTRNLTKVDELMKGDGWAKGSDGIWAKNGKKAEIENSTTAGNKRRELTQEILASQWK